MDKDYLSGTSAVQIAGSVEQAIRAGRLAGDDPLPPIREAAARLGVNRNTVAQAYGLLRDRGLVYGRGRGGTRVTPAPDVGQELSVVRTAPDALDLASGNIDASLLPSLARAAARMQWQQTGYDRAGEDPELLDLFRATFRDEAVPAEHLMLGHSALDLVERALRGHIQPGSRVLVEDPVWPPLLALLRSLGVVVDPVPVDEQGVVPDKLAQGLGPAVAAVVLTPRAQNPTGLDLPVERLEAIQRTLQDHPHVLLILDDHWGPLSAAPAPRIDPALSGWLLIRSVSKFLGPDLRLAVATGDGMTIARMARQFSVGPRWVSRLVQRMAIELWRDEETHAQVATARRTYAERRQALLDALRRNGFRPSDGSGVNLWLGVRDEAAIVERMAHRGYAIQGGQPFRLRSSPGVRLSIGNMPVPEALAIAAALRESSEGAATPLV